MGFSPEIRHIDKCFFCTLSGLLRYDVLKEDIMSQVSITLTDSNRMAHVPLAALGYALQRAHVLDPLRPVTLPIKTIDHSPTDKIIEAVVLILAGGRATSQIDLLLRPNRGLAQAWGQAQFAQQSTFADALDAFATDNLSQLRCAFETITQQQGHAPAHDFRTGRLWLDDDLTGLPASRRAEGSTYGYLAGEKTKSGVNSRASVCPAIARRSGRCCIRAVPMGLPRSNRVWN